MGSEDAPAAAGTESKQQTPSRRRRTPRKTEQQQTPDDTAAADGAGSSPEPTPRKRAKRTPQGAAAAAAAAEPPPAAAAAAEPPAAAAAAAAGSKAKPKPKRSSAAKPPSGPLYEVSMRAPTFDGAAHKFISWNVAGMRALLRKDAAALRQLVEQEQVDAVCIQEHKLQESHVAEVVKQVGLEGWHITWNCSTAKKGYSGTATLCRHKPLSTQTGIGAVEHDDEGRVVTVELPELWLVNVYTPNSGEGLKRLDYRIQQWDKALAAYIKGLRSSKPVVVCGDLNCAHTELDLYDPRRHAGTAGFTKEERESFGSELLGGAGLVDAWRAQHPGVVGYTYYSFRGANGGMRAQGKGWRLDYTLVSEDLAPRVHDTYILRDVVGSDHVPLGIVIKKE